MGRVLFSGFRSGFNFQVMRSNSGWVSARVTKIWFWSSSGQVFLPFSSQFLTDFDKKVSIFMEWLDGGVVHVKNHWQKWWSSACQIKFLLDSGLSGWTKLYLGLLGFIKKLFWSGRVGQNGLGLGQISGRVLARPIPNITLGKKITSCC